MAALHVRDAIGLERERRVIDQNTLWWLLAAILAFEVYLHLPPIIPYLTGIQLIPTGTRLIYNGVALVYGYYLSSVVDYTFVDSLLFGSTWITTTIYVIADTLYGVPLQR